MEAVEEKMHVYGLYTYLHWGNGCDALMLEATAGLNKLLISKNFGTCSANLHVHFEENLSSDRCNLLVKNVMSRCRERMSRISD